MTELHDAIKEAIQRNEIVQLEATEAATRRVIKVLQSLGYRQVREMAFLTEEEQQSAIKSERYPYTAVLYGWFLLGAKAQLEKDRKAVE